VGINWSWPALSWLNRLLTGEDNHTPDTARVGWLIGNIAIVVAALKGAFSGIQINLMDFAMALGVVNGSSAASTMATRSSQPSKETVSAHLSSTDTVGSKTTTVEMDSTSSGGIDSPG
jgi:hypothetical protein